MSAAPVEEMRRQFDNLFDSLFGDFGSRGLFPQHRFGSAFADLSPNFDISETDDDVKIAAELPGMDEKDIEVNLENNVLTIRARSARSMTSPRRTTMSASAATAASNAPSPCPMGWTRST